MDIDGDGTPDDPATGLPGGFTELSGTNASVTVTFGGAPAVWPIPNYYAARATFRRLSSSGGTVEDTVTVHVPVSLVVQSDVALEGSPIKRSELTMIPLFTTAASGFKGTDLTQRTAVLIGGNTNGSALRDVERITQNFSPPTAIDTYETIQGDTVLSKSVSMNVARRGHVSFLGFTSQGDTTNGSAYFSIGGQNSANGLLANTECQPGNDAGGTIGWRVGPEITTPSTYPLVDALGAPLANTATGILAADLFCGGLHKATPDSTAIVSGLTISYNFQNDPIDPDEDFPPGPDATGRVGQSMITPRYDGTLAVVSANQIYAIGGREALGQSVATVEVFDASTGTWSAAPNMKEARSGCTAQVIDGKIYVYGGAYYPDDKSPKTMVLTAEVFNPETGVWSYTKPPKTATDNGASCCFPGPGAVGNAGVHQNTIWYFGGSTVSGSDTNFLQEFVYFFDFVPAI
jgi:hypothetical protein